MGFEVEAHSHPCKVFIFWEPPPLTFLKVNFDDSIISNTGEVGFIIRSPDFRLVAMGGSHIFRSLIPEVELPTA